MKESNPEPVSAGPSQEKVLSLRGLQLAFGSNKVLRGFDLDLYRGETVMVLGKSGSGKSVLIKCIVRLLMPTGGSVDVLGHDVLTLARHAQFADDGVRIKVGNQTVLNEWHLASGTTEYITEVVLAQGAYPIVIEYFDSALTARVSAWWERVGSAP